MQEGEWDAGGGLGACLQIGLHLVHSPLGHAPLGMVIQPRNLGVPSHRGGPGKESHRWRYNNTAIATL